MDKAFFKSKKALYIFGALLIILASCIALFFARKNSAKQPERSIVIAYSTDSNYVYPTIVSMESLMKNANKNTFCKFTVLTADNVSDESKEQIKSIKNRYSNCSVNLVDMGKKFSGSEEKFWSKAMYYRLNLPEILPDEKICVYLDGDTMVRKDIGKMFDIDMTDYYIAGIHDYNEYINPKSTHHKDIGIANLDNYVCSGVLIMNLEKMRSDNMHDTFNKLIEKNDKEKIFKFPDQDTLNVACYGHILTLPFKYGALAHTGFEKTYSESEYARWVSSEEEWNTGRLDPTIIHFTGEKPWSHIYSDFCKEWWNYAAKTGYKNQIDQKYEVR